MFQWYRHRTDDIQRMSRLSWVLSSLLLWSLTRGDTEVSCVFMESCILPCSFQSGADPVIHWNLVTAGNLHVHSFYFNQDQLGLQDQNFINRTSLFKDQISRGNASLQLTGVEVQDQGRYRCHTSTIRGKEESFINLRVDAPVSKVNMERVGNRIICSSEGIYPEPDLTWSTSPPSNLTLQNQTSIQQTEQQLYNISSSLILSDSETDLIYICTISTRSNSRNTTLFKTTSKTVTDPETTEKSTNVGAIIGGVVGVILVVAAVVVLLVLCCKKKTGQQKNKKTESNHDETQMGMELEEPLNKEDPPPDGRIN